MNDLTYYEALFCTAFGMMAGAVAIISWKNNPIENLIAIGSVFVAMFLVWAISFSKNRKEVEANKNE